MDSIHNVYSRREALAWAPKKRHLPVTLVTGFLGAGKTTLLKYVLSNKHNLKVAAAVNDFAALNVDGQIVRGHRANDGVVELTNGCLCCSISSQFQTAVWSLLQDADIGKVDYLLIETSGVSDPLATIATLEQDYGKMYRIRLDSVVTVVDSDALVSRLEEGATDVIQSAAADSQLQCADIVLLNKKDLLSDTQMELAVKFIQEYVPGAKVYSCVKCAVPLNYIMEVDEVKRIETVVSHEVASAAYTIGTGGGMIKVRQKRLKESNRSTKDHIGQDEFTSLVFENSQPLSLAGFQQFLGCGFPRGVSRMKGTLWFIENRSTLYSFHMSGRQRYELTPCASVGESLAGTFSVQLVVIGQGIDAAGIEKQLQACVGLSDDSQGSQAISQLVTADPCFELIEATADYVDFRVTGVVEKGITVSEAASIHGINFNRMNSELVKRVNGSSGPVSLLPVLLVSGTQVIRTAPVKDFSESWKRITTIAKQLIEQFFKAVGFCKCGM